MKFVIESVETAEAPIPLAPYSQAKIAAHVLSLSGIIGIDPAANKLVEDVQQQTTQTIRNIEAIKSKGHQRLMDLGMSKYSKVNNENKVFYVNPEDLRIIKTICNNRLVPNSVQYKKVDELPLKALVEIRSKETNRYFKPEDYYKTEIHSSDGAGLKAIIEIEDELKGRGFGLDRVFYAEVHTNSLEKSYGPFNNVFGQRFPQKPSRAMFQLAIPHEIEIFCEAYVGKLDN